MKQVFRGKGLELRTLVNSGAHLSMQVHHRILALRTCTNVFRLLRLLARRVGDHQVPLGRLLVRPCGVAITIKMDSVVKHITDFSSQPNVNPDINVLKKVLLFLRGALCQSLAPSGQLPPVLRHLYLGSLSLDVLLILMYRSTPRPQGRRI